MFLNLFEGLNWNINLNLLKQATRHMKPPYWGSTEGQNRTLSTCVNSVHKIVNIIKLKL